LLIPNVKYPTFQLHVLASGCGVDTESVLKILILETMQWLKQRFRAHELPKELDLPDTSCYMDFELSSLKSFHLDVGYKLEIIWLPEDKIWALQLTEPDLGPRPGENNSERPPVPGRLIETNISYVVVSGGVECGFKTVVSEPEGTGSSCEVFRYAFIKYLVRNPLIKLCQTWRLIEEAHKIENISDLKRLSSWLEDKERMMPAVIISEHSPEQKSFPEIPKVPELYCGFGTSVQRKLELEMMSKKTVQGEPRMPLDLTDLIHYRMGYAQFFILQASVREEFSKKAGLEIGNGEIIIIEPKRFGKGVKRFIYSEIVQNPAKVKEELDSYIQNYPRGREMAFGRCVFVPEAKELERKKIIAAARSKEELADYYIEKIREKDNELDEYWREIRGRENKISRLEQEIDKLEEEKKAVLKQLDDISLEYQKKLDAKDEEIEHYKALLDRPQRLDGVSKWVEKHLSGRLILHERAKDMLKKTAAEKVNLPLLCDALEHLATDFRDELLGIIDEEERRARCSRKYNRNFEIVLTKGAAVNRYPKEYKIKYMTGYKGRPVETLLDYHLKVGNDSANLLRIYFLYDKEKKLIVVGSLPEHLSTTIYK